MQPNGRLCVGTILVTQPPSIKSIRLSKYEVLMTIITGTYGRRSWLFKMVFSNCLLKKKKKNGNPFLKKKKIYVFLEEIMLQSQVIHNVLLVFSTNCDHQYRRPNVNKAQAQFTDTRPSSACTWFLSRFSSEK